MVSLTGWPTLSVCGAAALPEKLLGVHILCAWGSHVLSRCGSGRGTWGSKSPVMCVRSDAPGV